MALQTLLFSMLLASGSALRMQMAWSDNNDEEDTDTLGPYELDGDIIEPRQVESMDLIKGLESGGTLARSKAMSNIHNRMWQEFGNKFAKRPDPQNFEQIFSEAVARGRQDPCNAQIMSGFARNNNAYGSNVLLFLNQVMMGVYFNKSIAMCANSYSKNFWNRFMDDPHQMGMCHEKGPCALGMDDSEVGNDISKRLFKEHPKYLVTLKRFLYKKYYTFKPEVANQIQDKMELLGVKRGQKYVGVHIRHGDKTKHEGHLNISVAQYAGNVSQFLTDDNHMVYLATDDPWAKQDMVRYFRNKDMNVPVAQTFDPNADHGYQTSHPGESWQSHENSLQVLGQDIYALNHAYSFIGTQNSNMGVAAYYGREDSEEADSQTHFMDRTFGHWSWL